MFRDGEGREWTPRVTCGAIAYFERESGVRLLKEVGKMLYKYQDAFTSGDKNKIEVGELLETVFSDLLGGTFDNLILLAYSSVKKQADERGVSFDAFKDMLDGESLKELLPIIKGEYENFFLKAAGDLITIPEPKK